MKRFNFDADSHWEAEHYILGRARQLLTHRVFLKELRRLKHGVLALFEGNGILYQAVYVLEQHRGKGHFKKMIKEVELPVITMDDCLMESYLLENDIKHVCFRSNDTPEYRLIENHYGDTRSKRSDVLYMNHIDEGLAILQWLGTTAEAKTAYCLHPIFQTDNDLDCARFYSDKWKECHPTSILLALEYRSVANEYLSPKDDVLPSAIRLSPLKEVNDMLIADKVQNRKDFELYHETTHPRSKELARYFRNWLERLEVSEEQYAEYKGMLTLPEENWE